MNKKYLIASSIFFFVLGVLLSHTYRPYIYGNNIYDFHIADTIGNLVAVPSAVCFGLVVYPQQKLYQIVIAAVFSFILYEMLGLISFQGVFDVYDIIATIISGLITFVILYFISRKKNERNRVAEC